MRSLTLTFRARDKKLKLNGTTALMGVVNVTPDSFHAASRRFETAEAVERCHALVDQGANIVDIGGESTRPGAEPVTLEAELERVIPVIEQLSPQTEAILSVDTRKAEVARRALAAGADMVNDVSALGDPDMAGTVARAGAGLAIMHMQGTPATMQRKPRYSDVVREVRDYLRAAAEKAEAAGVGAASILVDPGIGFGKTLKHNLALLSELKALHGLGKPVLVGTSRKRFLGWLTGKDAPERLIVSIASAVAAALEGAHILRVHDVAETREALRIADAVRNARAETTMATSRLEGVVR